MAGSFMTPPCIIFKTIAAFLVAQREFQEDRVLGIDSVLLEGPVSDDRSVFPACLR